MTTPDQANPGSGPRPESATPGAATGPRRKATETAETVTEEARELWHEATHEAAGLRDEATRHARARAEGAKDSLAEEVASVGDALRKASDELRHGSPQAQLFGGMAAQLAGFADTLRDRDVGQIVDDVSRFGRRNPGAFLGGAALLGFAAVRMARASAEGDDSPAAGRFPPDANVPPYHPTAQKPER